MNVCRNNPSHQSTREKETDYTFLAKQFVGTFPQFWLAHGSDILTHELTSIDPNTVAKLPEKESADVDRTEEVNKKRAEMEVYWKVYNYFNQCRQQSHGNQTDESFGDNDDDKSSYGWTNTSGCTSFIKDYKTTAF